MIETSLDPLAVGEAGVVLLKVDLAETAPLLSRLNRWDALPLRTFCTAT